MAIYFCQAPVGVPVTVSKPADDTNLPQVIMCYVAPSRALDSYILAKNSLQLFQLGKISSLLLMYPNYFLFYSITNTSHFKSVNTISFSFYSFTSYFPYFLFLFSSSSLPGSLHTVVLIIFLHTFYFASRLHCEVVTQAHASLFYNVRFSWVRELPLVTIGYNKKQNKKKLSNS